MSRTAPTAEPVATDAAAPTTTWATLRRGLALSPEFRVGLGVTMLLALVATAGRVVVPLAVQQTIDAGLVGGSPDLDTVRRAVAAAAVAVVLTAVAAYFMNVRLYRATETALASLRTRAFRHVHDLSVLHTASQRRGALVSRVTSDVDQLSTFMQWGGILLVVSLGQLILATGLMAYYSVPLTLLVLAVFVPLVLAVRYFQKRLAAQYTQVRERVAEMLGAVGESVVGAPVIRAYGVTGRTAERVDRAIRAHQVAATRAQRFAALMFSTGEVVAAAATAAVVVVGVQLGVGGGLTAGQLVAFLFLVTLFVSPVQVATEVLNEAQNAVAGWRRVLGVIDTEPDVADPALRPAGGRDLPAGALSVTFDAVGFAYPGATREALRGLDLTIAPRRRVAVVGQTGSGKTTLAKLVTRLMDPTRGRVLLSGVPVDDVEFSTLRRRVVMVPQDGFLVDATIADNVRYGRPDLSDLDVAAAFDDIGLGDWLASLPEAEKTRVGERGGALSVGERQLVAVVRAAVADPDLLVLDEATSAVDPATEVRLAGALDALMRGRTSLIIAHRLSTAEAADEVLVVDDGEVVQRGTAEELAAEPGVYAGLHASWAAGSRA